MNIVIQMNMVYTAKEAEAPEDLQSKMAQRKLGS